MSKPGGAELARQFYTEVVGPLLARELPELRYAAGRLGSGSDVLGFDDAMSRDHDWGCRLTLLVDAADEAAVPAISTLLERGLPQSFLGLPVRSPLTWNAAVTHQVEVATVAWFAASRLGVDPTSPLTPADWLILNSQAVLEVTAGPVFTDQTTALAPARAALRWYPPDVERYVLAAGWQRIEQQLPFAGRTGMRGDELGSRLLCAQLADDLVARVPAQPALGPLPEVARHRFPGAAGGEPARRPARRRADRSELAGPRSRVGGSLRGAA